jgi:hypothetical protein
MPITACYVGGCLQVHFSTDFGSTFTNTLAKGAVTMDWGVPAIHGKETVFWTQKRPNGTYRHRLMVETQ